MDNLSREELRSIISLEVRKLFARIRNKPLEEITESTFLQGSDFPLDLSVPSLLLQLHFARGEGSLSKLVDACLDALNNSFAKLHAANTESETGKVDSSFQTQKTAVSKTQIIKGLSSYFQRIKEEGKIKDFEFTAARICCTYWRVILLNGAELIVKYCSNENLVYFSKELEDSIDERMLSEILKNTERIIKGKSFRVH